MNILIDIFFLLLVVLIFVGVSRKNTVRASIRLAAVVIAAAGMMTAPTIAPSVAMVFEPSVQNNAAADFAAIANTPVMDNAEETLGKIDLTQLQQKLPDKFEAIAASYGVAADELLAAAEEENAPAKEAALLGAPLSKALAQACCGLLLALILVFVVAGGLTALIRRQRKSKERQKMTFASAVIAAAFVVIPLFELFRPFSAGILGTMQWNISCEKSVFYRLLQWCNPFV